MNLNPTALALWIFTASVGFLIGGTLTATVAGLAVGVGMTLLSDIFF